MLYSYFNKKRTRALLWGKTMKLEKFAVSDYETIKDFMTPIWHTTYAFLPREQVELLLDKYFSEDGLKHYRELGYTYMKLVDKKTVGIVVFCEREDETYLEFCAKSSNKGVATEFLKEKFSITGETVAFGDSEGDYAMFKKADRIYIPSTANISFEGGKTIEDVQSFIVTQL